MSRLLCLSIGPATSAEQISLKVCGCHSDPLTRIARSIARDTVSTQFVTSVLTDEQTSLQICSGDGHRERFLQRPHAYLHAVVHLFPHSSITTGLCTSIPYCAQCLQHSTEQSAPAPPIHQHRVYEFNFGS